MTPHPANNALIVPADEAYKASEKFFKAVRRAAEVNSIIENKLEVVDWVCEWVFEQTDEKLTAAFGAYMSVWTMEGGDQ